MTSQYKINEKFMTFRGGNEMIKVEEKNYFQLELETLITRIAS